MSISHTLILTSTNEAGISSSVTSVAVAGNQEINIPKLVAASQTNLLVPLAFPVASVVSVAIVADQICTLKTNSSGSPQDTFTLAANVPLTWQFGSPVAVPFAGNVSALYVTTTPATSLKLRILLS